MQSAAVERTIQSSGTLGSASFGISQKHAAHIMGILRSTLYSRKALAVLREYGSNAWDEHRQSGQRDRPIFVQLPSFMKPTLKIRDYGRGLSESDVFNIYTQYGESTKRDTNDAAGMLGIGCKAGFAYTDSFTVTSWHGGTKSIYNAVLDKSNKGEMQKMYEEPCGDETGIEIQMAVRPRDVDEFVREARTLFRYFNPQPQINLPLDSLPRGMAQGFITEHSAVQLGGTATREWIAVMGCIPYRLDLEQLKEGLTEAGLWEALGHLSGGLYLPIGSVEFSASREELQYTEATVSCLLAQFGKLVQEYIDDALTSLTKPDVKDWDRRLKATFMQHILKFPLPKEFKTWTDYSVVLLGKESNRPKTFVLKDQDWSEAYRVTVKQDARVLIHDGPKGQVEKGWHFNYRGDVIAVPVGDATYSEVEAELQTLIKTAGLEGLPVCRMTTRAYWAQPVGRNGRVRHPANQKHKDRTFTLKGRFDDSSPRSQYWESATPPEDEHVYVIISEFSPLGSPSLAEMVRDQQLFKRCNVPWPTIYGYKTTSVKPITGTDIENGTSYKTWREKAFLALITEEIKDDLREIAWGDLFASTVDGNTSEYYRRPFRGYVAELVTNLTRDLGEKHAVTRYFAKHLEGRAYCAKFQRGHREQVLDIATAANYQPKRSGPKEWLLRLMAAYPMLTLTGQSDYHMSIFRQHYKTLVAYIKTQDKIA